MTTKIATLFTNSTFTAVKVVCGRKFKGEAYDLGFNDMPNRVAWNVTCWSRKLWCPTTGRFVYANPDFIQPRDVSEEVRSAEFESYVKSTIQSTADWCRSTKPSLAEDELKNFVRNVVRKQHPEMLEVAEELLGWSDNRDVAVEVRKTIEWAMTLKTRPMWLYGRYCAGGRDIPAAKKVAIAKSALAKRGITQLDGFDVAWTMTLDVYGLPHAA